MAGRNRREGEFKGAGTKGRKGTGGTRRGEGEEKNGYGVGCEEKEIIYFDLVTLIADIKPVICMSWATGTSFFAFLQLFSLELKTGTRQTNGRLTMAHNGVLRDN